MEDKPANEIINRVDQSGIKSLDLEVLYDHHERITLDIKDQLFQGMILREKDFREFVKTHDWQKYQGKNVAITCSADAIVPTWAFMLIATRLGGMAHHFVFGSPEDLEQSLFQKALDTLDWKAFENQNVVVKGCSDVPVPVFAYVETVRRLRPLAKKIMYGEPCSTVPLYKKEIPDSR